MDRELSLTADGVRLDGTLAVPPHARGVVLFAHGSGSGRHSPRNRLVAAGLNRAGLATLLFDLLTAEEATDRANVFDVPLLARRLGAAAHWLRGPSTADGSGHGLTAPLPYGLFGASTGAAAALVAAAEPDSEAVAVVSRGGRPDLAGARLASVTAPTLLIVGGADQAVLGLNEEARRSLRCPTELAVVPGATHLFEEPGALEAVVGLARDWFLSHFP